MLPSIPAFVLIRFSHHVFLFEASGVIPTHVTIERADPAVNSVESKDSPSQVPFQYLFTHYSLVGKFGRREGLLPNARPIAVVTSSYVMISPLQV